MFYVRLLGFETRKLRVKSFVIGAHWKHLKGGRMEERECLLCFSVRRRFQHKGRVSPKLTCVKDRISMSDGRRLSHFRVDDLLSFSHQRWPCITIKLGFSIPALIVSDRSRHALTTAGRLFYGAATTVSLLAARSTKALAGITHVSGFLLQKGWKGSHLG